MSDINLNVGDGFTFTGNKLTLNFKNSEYVEKRESGLYIADLNGAPGQSGRSTEDNYTIIKNASGKLETDPFVIEYIFSMSAYKIDDVGRESVDTYHAIEPLTIKSVNDIINELNYCIDKDHGTSTTASYLFKTNNLLELRNTVTSQRYSSRWSAAMDDLNRRENDTCLALFRIANIQYSPNNRFYCRHIDLTCLYSSIPEYVKGGHSEGSEYYTANSKNEY